MKNWPLILERAIEDVNEAFGVNVTEYGRYLVERGGRERPPAACHLDVAYERTDQALKAAWRRIADLPKQIADDVPDPSTRWYWAREFYWNVPGAMPDAFVEEVAAHLLRCQSSDVPDLLGESPRPLQCGRCCELFTPLSSEGYRQAVQLDEQMPPHFFVQSAEVPKLATDCVSSRDKIGWGLDSPRKTKEFSCTERRLSEWDVATDQKTPNRAPAMHSDTDD